MKNRIPRTTRVAIAEQIKNRPDLRHRDIADNFHVSKEVVSKIAQEFGVQRKKSPGKYKKISDDEMKAIERDLRSDELSALQISRKYGRARNTILELAKRLCPDLDMQARGHRIRIKTRWNEMDNLPPAQKKEKRYNAERYRRKKAERDKWKECPREARIIASQEAIKPTDPMLAPRLSWDTIGLILEARYHAGENELEGSFDRKAINTTAIKALDKLRTVLEQYEYPDDTPNRSGDTLRANMQ